MESYCDKVRRFYGTAGGNAYPAPGANGPAQTLYENHATYGSRQNGPPVVGSDSYPGGPGNPTRARIVR